MILRRLIQLTVTLLLAGLAIGVGLRWPARAVVACAPTRPGGGSALGVVRFLDATRHTSLVIETDPSATDRGAFTFETGSGVQYSGGPAHGLAAGDNSASAQACAGLTQVSYTGAAQMIAPAQQSAHSTVSTTRVELHATLDLVHLAATIDFRDLTNGQVFAVTTQAPPDALQTSKQFNQNAVQQNWTAVYQDMASADVQGMTPDQFAQTMTQSAQTTGTVTNITITSAPVVKSSQDGIVYYIVDEQVTLSLNGATSQVNIASVFLLEDGQWRFWFSKNL